MTKTIAIALAVFVAIASPAAHAEQYDLNQRYAIAECAYQYLVQTGKIMTRGGVIPREVFFTPIQGDLRFFNSAVVWATTMQDACLQYADVVMRIETTMMTIGQ